MDETVVIHGAALDRAQFDKMASVGSDLVWSPISNLLLYGNTTNVRAADAAGVPISLAPDWGPSGSKNNLHELKVADLWNKEVMDSYFTDYEMAQMVTSNPAKAAKWDSFVGQLKSGMYADLVVIDTFHDDPYRNLIEAIDADVRLTVVQGKAVFGDVDIMTAINQDDWEPINGGGVSKAVDVTSLSEVDGSQTWASIEAGLAMAMRNEFSDIKQHWNDVSDMSDSEIHDWLNSTFDGDYRDDVNHLKNMTVDPIFTTGDERYFDVINRSSHANTHVDLTKLYSYYDIQMDTDGQRTGSNVDLSTDPVNNGNTGGNGNSGNTGGNDNSGNTDTIGNTDTTGSTDTTDNTQSNCPDGDTSADCVQQDSGISDTDASSSDSDESSAKYLLIGAAAVLGIALYFFGKSSGDELNLNQEAMIEKMWDDDALGEATPLVESEQTFVPSLPPIDALPPSSSEEE